MSPTSVRNETAAAAMVLDSDDESVESEMDVNKYDEEPIVSIDDISLVSREPSSQMTPGRGLPASFCSFESLFGELSVEASLKDHGENEAFEKLDGSTDYAPRAPRVEVNFSPAVMLRGNNPASGSSGSIRDLLSFRSINENQDYDSEDSSDEDDSSTHSIGHDRKGRPTGDDSINSEVLDFLLRQSDSANFINKSKRVVGTRTMKNAEFMSRSTWTTNRNVVMEATRKTASVCVGETSSLKDSERKLGNNDNNNNKRNEQWSSRRKSGSKNSLSLNSGKKKISTADPLLDRFLSTRAKKKGQAAGAAAPTRSN